MSRSFVCYVANLSQLPLLRVCSFKPGVSRYLVICKKETQEGKVVDHF